MRRGLVRVALLLLLLLAATGCAETCREVIARLQPSYADKRAQLARIARDLPPPGSVRVADFPASLDPPLVIDEEAHRINTDVLPVERLLDPDAERKASDFWIYPNPLLTCVQWTGPRNPLDPSVMDSAAGEGVGGCPQVLAQPYVLAVRTLRYDIPEAVAIEAFLVDLRSGRIRGQFPLSFRSPYRSADLGRGPWAKRSQSEAASVFWDIMHCGLVSALGRFPGAKIVVRTGCGPSGPETQLEPLRSVPALVVAAPLSGSPQGGD
jgi:hypothetical protein